MKADSEDGEQDDGTMDEIVKYQLHPACAAWPPMPDHEIEALAADIKANGLLEPITLTPDKLLLDGRNRAKACERAGVTPATTVYAGDPVLFSLSKNRHRRHMSVDQIAMVAAALVTTTQGRPSKEKTSFEVFIDDAVAASGVPRTAIDSARTVLRDGTPEEVQAVKTGKAKVRATADKVRARKKTAKEAPPKVAPADAVRSAPTPPKATPSLPSDAPVEIDASILSLSAQKRFEALERRLRADMEAEIERRVREGVREGVRQALAKRDAYDVERIEQANAVLERGSKKPFTAGEYTKILCLRWLREPPPQSAEKRPSNW